MSVIAPVSGWGRVATSQEESHASPSPPTLAPAASSDAGSPLAGLRQSDEWRQGAKQLLRRPGVRRHDNPSPTTAGAPSAPRGVPLEDLRQTRATLPTHYERREMPSDPQSLARFLCDAHLAAYAYHRDPMALPDGWAPAGEMANKVRRGMGLGNRGVESGAGAIVDRESGLTAVLLLNRQSGEVVVSFGGTTSGKKTGHTLAERSKPGRNFMSTLSQWRANVYAGLGGTPKSYEQADALLKAVQGLADKGHTVRLIGHSKGGGETTYASLMAKNPVEVDNFSPAHLSDGLVKKLPPHNLARAKELIRSFSPYGDPVAGLRGKLPGLHGVGVGYHFDGIAGSSAIDKHDQFLRHAVHHCAQQEGSVNPAA